MNSTEQDLAARLDEAARKFRRDALRLACLRALIALAVSLAAIAAADAVLALPATVRVALDVVALAGPVVAAILFMRGLLATTSLRNMLARKIEQSAPVLDNAITNALDFSARISSAEEKGISASLMRSEVAESQRRLVVQSPAIAVHPPRWREEPRLALLVFACIAILAIVGWPVLRAVFPRLLDPFGDHPPYSPTRLVVQPGDATVEYGDSLDVKVRTSGPTAADLRLVVEATNGATLAELPLYESEPGIYLQKIERVVQNARYFAAMRGGRSERFDLRVAPHPRIDTARFTIVSPAYTHMQPETRFLTDAGIRGYSNSDVTVTLTANRPLTGGTLRVNNSSVTLQPAPEPNTVRATFPLTSSGTFSASVVDSEGHRSKQALAGKLEVVPDEAPTVTFVSPGKHSFATPGALVPLNIEARDDIGVARVSVVRSLNGSTDFKKTLYEDDDPSRSFVNVIDPVDLKDLGVQAGDVIEYYATASDGRPPAPRTAATPAFRLTIISDEEYRTLKQTELTATQLREDYEDIANQMREMADAQRDLQKQAAALEKAMNGDTPLSAEQKQKLAELKSQQAKLAEAAKKLGGDLNDDAESAPTFDVEHDFKKALKEYADAVNKAAEQMKKSADSMGTNGQQRTGADARQSLATSQSHQQEALDQLDPAAQQMDQKVGEASREIEKLAALDQDVEQFKYLLERQTAVERQSRTLAQNKSPDAEDSARMRDLADEQNRIAKELSGLKQSFKDDSMQVTGAYPRVASDAQEIAKKIESLGIEKTMGNAAGDFAGQNPEQGHQKANDALEAMKSMVSFCKGAQGEGEQECENRLKIKMNVGLGQTFPQMRRNQRNGSGRTGASGLSGQGSQGSESSSMSSPYSVYGPDERQSKKSQLSSRAGRKQSERTPPMGEAPGIAADVEEVHVNKRDDLKVDAAGDEAAMKEYDAYITEYFRRMSEAQP